MFLSIRERNIKLLLETVIYIATAETATCISTTEINIHVDNALQKVMWRKMWSFQKYKVVLHFIFTKLLSILRNI